MDGDLRRQHPRIFALLPNSLSMMSSGVAIVKRSPDSRFLQDFHKMRNVRSHRTSFHNPPRNPRMSRRKRDDLRSRMGSFSCEINDRRKLNQTSLNKRQRCNDSAKPEHAPLRFDAGGQHDLDFTGPLNVAHNSTRRALVCVIRYLQVCLGPKILRLLYGISDHIDSITTLCSSEYSIAKGSVSGFGRSRD